jgi:MFS family permease
MGRPFLALVACFVIGGVAGAPVRALLPAYVEGVVGAPPGFTAVLFAIQLAASGTFAMVAGSLSDRFGPRAIVLAGIPAAMPGALLFATTDQAILIPLAALFGVMTGLQTSAGQGLLISAVDPARIGVATATFFLASTFAGAVGAWVGGVLADAAGYPVVGMVGVALAVVAVITAILFLPAAPEPHARKPISPIQTVEAEGERSGAMASVGYVSVLRSPGMWAILQLRFWPTIAWGIATLAIPLYLFRLAGNATVPGTYALASLGVASVGQFVTGRLVDVATRRRPGLPLELRRLVATISVGLVIASGLAMLSTGNVLALAVAGTAWTTLAWALATTMPPLMRGSSPGGFGRAVGLTELTWSVAMLTGTTLAGVLADMGTVVPFGVATACLLVSAAVAVRFATVHQDEWQPSADVLRHDGAGR